MSDEYENNKSGYQAQSSEAITGSAGSASPDIDYVRPCLLYTSPSPRDKRQSRMPSSA